MSSRALVVSAASVLLAASALAAEPLSRMYDLRDLAAVLPARNGSGTTLVAALPGGAGVPVLKDIPIISRLFTAPTMAGEGMEVAMSGVSAATMGAGTSGIGDARAENEETGQTPTDELVGKLTNLCSLSFEELVEHVYIVDGEEASHKKFADAIESVRGLYQDRVIVEITCDEVDGQLKLGVGAAAPKSEAPAMQARAMVVRKTVARLDALRTTSYIARWTPVVADGSVGLEPGTSTITDGVSLAVLVGAGKDRTRVAVHGVISKADIQTVKVPTEQAAAAATSISAGGPLLTIGLPRVERRTVDTDVSVEINRPTVVATVPGFREGTQIQITVTVRTE